ncbi:MAG TPA: DUF5009 domain-containing protein [Candidatus Hydrogenedentes bacterium]|nr:DUF5009 domain-containing protein [Candidatus Hydrogenedentota bacterium]HPC15022.1 DUF5009 domain-containing protein [Candidatus Hydrogenedentota bacterium]HRT19117.1 DUF5009 domain-containing protein [Candidatus Hydrogenedentota bacterium]HRT64046.1 DUF5009 domain-containing protein [Candidatus Hydrogenedentota bacterium]
MKESWDATAIRPRVMSVDALRGFDMFWIMGGGEAVKQFIRLFGDPMPAGIARQFSHVEWEGFAAWDLIMPLFLFIVGVAMPFSVGRRIERGDTRAGIYRHTARRVIVLFILGMIAQGHLLTFDLDRIHIYCNTLQAIAAGYLVATMALVHLRIAGQAALCAALLIGFWLIMILVPVPGHGAGVLTPDGNLAMFIDEAVLGRFRDGTHYTWILSSMGFAGSVLLGMFGGHILKSERLTQGRKAFALVGMGVALTAGGLIWSLWFPIIKHIWTSSFVLFAAGLSYLLLAAFYTVMDVFGHKTWAFPFAVIGANALLAYLAEGLVSAHGIAAWLFGESAREWPAMYSFPFALLVFVLLWIGLYVLYRKRVFVRV